MNHCAMLASLVCSLLLTSCVPPVRVAKRMKAPNASDLKLDYLTLIEPGVTTRDVVNEKLSSIATVDSDGMFWGRYYQSTWTNPGGYRQWERKNVIVNFDDSGLVRRVQVADDFEIGRVLREVFASKPARADREDVAPVKATGWIPRIWVYHGAELTVDNNAFTLVDHSKAGTTTVRMPFDGIKHARTSGPDSDFFPAMPMRPGIQLDLSGADATGKQRSVRIELSPQELLTWVDFVRRHCPSAKFD